MIVTYMRAGVVISGVMLAPGMLGCAHDTSPRPAFSDPAIAAAPAPSPSAAALAAKAAAPSGLSLDAPIETIADSSNGCAFLDKDFPGLREHPMYDYFKSMTLKQVAALSGGKITDKMLAKAQSDLAALPH